MAHGLLESLMKKKGADEDMSPEYKQSKMKVLKDLHDEMTKMMGADLGGLKKVTVAAPDQQGLKEGLAHAQELMGHGTHLDDDSAEDDHEHEAEEPEMMSHGGMLPVNSDEDAASEEDAMESNPDVNDDVDGESGDAELEAKIKLLQAKLAQRKMK